MSIRKKILLIAGHGAGDPGAISKLGSRSWQEAQESRTLVPLIAAALKPCVDVTIYDTGRNAYYDYKAGTLAGAAKFAQYSYVLEVHFNACTPDQGDGKNKGSEIYVTLGEKDTVVEETILKQLQEIGFKSRGVKRKNYAVINQAKKAGTSSALLEVCFIDDADDMAIYARYRLAVADAVAYGILEGFGIQTAAQSAAKTNWETVKEKAGLSDSTMAYLGEYRFADDLLRKLAAAMQ